MSHKHQHPRFTFVVDLGDGSGDLPVGSFRRVRGLGASIETVEHREGNDPQLGTRKLPGLRHYDNVVLKRGISGDRRLWQWIAAEPPARRTVTITMLDRARTPVLRFVLHNAWPCRYTGPALDTKGHDIAIESIELCHEGLAVEAP